MLVSAKQLRSRALPHYASRHDSRLPGLLSKTEHKKGSPKAPLFND
jgi:hypothetical protein